LPRNFIRRVEIMFPIEDEGLRDRLVNEILATMLTDNLEAWRLQPDGWYQRPGTGDHPGVRSQQRFVEAAREKTLVAEATTPAVSYRARTVPRARGPAPVAVWSVSSPGGSDRMAS
jgi:polyphosphate kinase